MGKAPVGVSVEGLRELSAALRKVGPEHAKELRVEFKKIAEIVARDARGRLPVRSGRAAASLRATGDARGAAVIGGRKSVPYYGWLDFGGTLSPSGRRRNTQSRPRLKEGRAIYPAIRANRDELLEASVRSLDNAKRQAGL